MERDIEQDRGQYYATRKKRWVIFTALSIIFLLATIGGYLIYTKNKAAVNPYPDDMRSKVSFNLYYPEGLSSNIILDQSSFRLGENNQAILFTLNDTKFNRNYYVSIQRYPADYNFSDFKKKFSESHETLSPVGSVFVGDLGSQIIASLQTSDNVWVLITVSDATAFGQVEDIIKKFRRVN